MRTPGRVLEVAVEVCDVDSGLSAEGRKSDSINMALHVNTIVQYHCYKFYS